MQSDGNASETIHFQERYSKTENDTIRQYSLITITEVEAADLMKIIEKTQKN